MIFGIFNVCFFLNNKKKKYNIFKKFKRLRLMLKHALRHPMSFYVLGLQNIIYKKCLKIN